MMRNFYTAYEVDGIGFDGYSGIVIWPNPCADRERACGVVEENGDTVITFPSLPFHDIDFLGELYEDIPHLLDGYGGTEIIARNTPWNKGHLLAVTVTDEHQYVDAVLIKNSLCVNLLRAINPVVSAMYRLPLTTMNSGQSDSQANHHEKMVLNEENWENLKDDVREVEKLFDERISSFTQPQDIFLFWILALPPEPKFESLQSLKEVIEYISSLSEDQIQLIENAMEAIGSLYRKHKVWYEEAIMQGSMREGSIFLIELPQILRDSCGHLFIDPLPGFFNGMVFSAQATAHIFTKDQIDWKYQAAAMSVVARSLILSRTNADLKYSQLKEAIDSAKSNAIKQMMEGYGYTFDGSNQTWVPPNDPIRSMHISNTTSTLRAEHPEIFIDRPSSEPPFRSL